MSELEYDRDRGAEMDACDVEDELELDDDCEDPEGCESEEELPTLGDMYGYENDEDNEEAAFDDVLKAQENAD